MKITRLPVRYESTSGTGTSTFPTLSEAVADALTRFDGSAMKVVRVEELEFSIEPLDVDALRTPLR